MTKANQFDLTLDAIWITTVSGERDKQDITTIITILTIITITVRNSP